MSTAILVPIYKKRFNNFEEISIDNLYSLFPDYPISFVCPTTFDRSYYISRYKSSTFYSFDDTFFVGLKGYNKLMLNVELYKNFEIYDYVLICQPDVYIFHNNLNEFLNKRYSFIGAPLPNSIVEGIEQKFTIDFDEKRSFSSISFFNGGISLRKVSDCIEVITKNNDLINRYLNNGWFEDSIFSILFSDAGYIIPDRQTALSFAMELYPKQSYINNNHKLPLGVHAWFRNDKRELYDNLFWFNKIVETTHKPYYTIYCWYFLSYWLIIKGVVRKRFKLLIKGMKL